MPPRGRQRAQQRRPEPSPVLPDEEDASLVGEETNEDFEADHEMGDDDIPGSQVTNTTATTAVANNNNLGTAASPGNAANNAGTNTHPAVPQTANNTGGGTTFPSSPASGLNAQTQNPPTSIANLKEIGPLASWTVSTAKPGCGVPELRSEDTNLYWQSDGPQPHTINIHFAKRVCIRLIRMYLDFESDESYTPTRIAIMSGTGYHDLQEVSTLSLKEPKGWVEFDLGNGGTGEVDGDGDGGAWLKTWLVQVVILGNHANGKDTHVRGLQVWAAASGATCSPAAKTTAPEMDQTQWTNSGILAELDMLSW